MKTIVFVGVKYGSFFFWSGVLDGGLDADIVETTFQYVVSLLNLIYLSFNRRNIKTKTKERMGRKGGCQKMAQVRSIYPTGRTEG